MAQTYPITETIEELSEIFSAQHGVAPFPSSKDEPKVKIHDTVGKVASIYEKIRNAVDYQEEHLIRKNAIARMLKRRIMTRERGMNIAEPLIRELVRAGYLKNDYFPEARLQDIERIVSKYVSLFHTATSGTLGPKQTNDIIKWVTSVASAEIEAFLAPEIKDDALVEAMYKNLRQQIDLTDLVSSQEDQDIQIYIAIHRALIKSDKAILRYHLIYYYAPWWRYATQNEVATLAAQLPQLMAHIDEQIQNKLSDRLFRYMKKFAPLFSILRNVLSEHPNDSKKILSDPAQLETAVREACTRRYTESSLKLSRGVIRSIIYIFLTKTIMAFVFELPYETIFLKEVKLTPLFINVLFHPFLMFVIATSIRVPAEKNTVRLLQGINEIIYNPKEKEVLRQREENFQTSKALNVVFSFLYFAAFIITFGGIIWVLNALSFSIVSGFLFMFFLSVISFFGLHLRNNAKDLVIITRRENFLMTIFEFFTLPILRAGRWIASKTSKVNVLMFALDFIIEAPFKVLLETIEEWLAFQRQKREEIQ